MAAAVFRNQELPMQAFSAGNTLQFGMPHAGVGLYARVTFRGTLTRTCGTAVGTVTASPYYPYSISDVTYMDYQGVTRINAKGYELNQVQQLKAFSFNPSFTLIPPGSSPGYAYSSDIYAAAVPAGTASSQTTSPCNYGFVVPLSLSRRSVRGTHPFTVPNSQDTLSLVCQSTAQLFSTVAVGPEQSFLTTGTDTVAITGNYDVAYYYYDVPAGVSLPMSEFQVIHELVTTRDTTNLLAGLQKLETLQTGRTYYRLLANLVLNAAPDTIDINNVQFIVDGGTPTMNENGSSYRDRIRNEFGQDLPPGLFVWDFTRKPWTPDSYGSLGIGLTIASAATVGTVAWLRFLRETLYVASANLQAIG